MCSLADAGPSKSKPAPADEISGRHSSADSPAAQLDSSAQPESSQGDAADGLSASTVNHSPVDSNSSANGSGSNALQQRLSAAEPALPAFLGQEHVSAVDVASPNSLQHQTDGASPQDSSQQTPGSPETLRGQHGSAGTSGQEPNDQPSQHDDVAAADQNSAQHTSQQQGSSSAEQASGAKAAGGSAKLSRLKQKVGLGAGQDAGSGSDDAQMSSNEQLDEDGQPSGPLEQLPELDLPKNWEQHGEHLWYQTSST